jgi:hypothetical protein
VSLCAPPPTLSPSLSLSLSLSLTLHSPLRAQVEHKGGGQLRDLLQSGEHQKRSVPPALPNAARGVCGGHQRPPRHDAAWLAEASGASWPPDGTSEFNSNSELLVKTFFASHITGPWLFFLHMFFLHMQEKQTWKNQGLENQPAMRRGERTRRPPETPPFPINMRP